MLRSGHKKIPFKICSPGTGCEMARRGTHTGGIETSLVITGGAGGGTQVLVRPFWKQGVSSCRKRSMFTAGGGVFVFARNAAPSLFPCGTFYFALWTFSSNPFIAATCETCGQM